jgi:hypothetical protein
MLQKALSYLTALKSAYSQEMHYCNIISRECMTFLGSLFEVVVGITETKGDILQLRFGTSGGQIQTSHIIKRVNISFGSRFLELCLSLFQISSYEPIRVGLHWIDL